MSLVCPICLEEYKNNINSEKTPRILSCGDTLCTQCLKKLIKDNVIKCPLCTKENFEEIEKYAVNKYIINLIDEKILSSIKYLDIKDGIKLENPDYQFSIALVGESQVGKTSIGNFYQTGKIIDNSIQTVGLNNSFKYLYVHQKTIKITLWDTAGEERYRSITVGYLRGVHALIIVFSLTNLLNKEDLENFKKKTEIEKNQIKEEYTKNTINNLKFWLEEFKQINTRKEHIIYLVGNKIDIGKEYKLTIQDEINNFVSNNNLKYYETSAMTGEKIIEMFNNLAFDLITIYSNSSDAATAHSFKLKNKIGQKKSCGC